MVDSRVEFDRLAVVWAVLGGAVFVIVCALVVGAVIAGRRRGAPSRRTAAHRLEFGVVAVLAVVAVTLATLAITSENRVDRVNAASPVRPLRVQVVSAQWRWEFTYPDLGVTSSTGPDGAPAVLGVPAGTPIAFELTSLDVLHSFWVPRRAFQRNAFPGRTTRFDLVWPTPGVETNAGCNEYCGTYHTQMLFTVDAMAPADFDAWVAARR